MGAADVGGIPRLWCYGCVSAEVVSEDQGYGPESLELAPQTTTESLELALQTTTESLELASRTPPHSLELASQTPCGRSFVVVAEAADTGSRLDGW